MNELKAALDEFRHSPVEVLSAMVVVLGAISTAFRAGRRFWSNLWARVQSKPIVPSETVRIVQGANHNWWNGGARKGDKQVLQVTFHGHVTSISTHDVRVLRAEIIKPRTVANSLSLCDGHDCRRPQFLEPDESTDIHAMFFVESGGPKHGLPWKASIAFIDQYGNKHSVKNCEFQPIDSGTPPPPTEPEEFPYEIPDPTEKEVVSVLKAELGRYNVCGRSCGGLGSVHIVYRGQAFSGVGGDGWKPNSPENQLLAPDPEAASLVSDNLQALMDFYKGLGDEERDRFRRALLNRLDARKGYQAVSYFIVLALWRVGSLADALQKAKRDLPENESRFFGLSNVLMLLNGMLRYRYTDFDTAALDTVEQLTHGLKEHAFLIPAKLAAIRAARLMER